MALFGEETVIITRVGEGSFNDEGRYVDGQPITFTVNLVFTPLTDQAADRIQDDALKAKNLKGMAEIMIEDKNAQLFTKDSSPVKKADIFFREGKYYEVDSMLWIGGGLPHWEGTCKLAEKDGN